MIDPLVTQRLGIGQRIRTLRKAKGLTQTWMADQLGITSAALSLYEHGKVAIPSPRLAQIAELLHVRPGSLYPSRAQTTRAEETTCSP